MSESSFTLPARPSLEQLRKQAKELLRRYRAGDSVAQERLRLVKPRLGALDRVDEATLADAQFALARAYGFESWAALVHHIDALQARAEAEASTPVADPLDPFERIAADMLAASQAGDAEALQRLNAIYGSRFTADELRAQLRQRLHAISGASPSPASAAVVSASPAPASPSPASISLESESPESGSPESTSSASLAASLPEPSDDAALTLADTRLLVARMYFFESWDTFARSSAQPPGDPRTVRHGMSSTPPFYRIDWHTRTLEPRPPLSDRDWDTICGLMTELGITGLRAFGQMTDAALARVSALDHVTSLNISDSSRISDDGLRHLARMPQLRHLDLGGWSDRITDRGLAVLRELPLLTDVALRWQQGITDAGVAHLAACERLEIVDLMGTRTGDDAIRALAGKRHLRQLKTGALVTAAGLPHLHGLPMFKAWHAGDIRYGLMEFVAEPTYLLLPPAPFTERGLERLAGLDGLFALNVDGPQVMTAAGLQPLAALPHLGWLGCDPTDDAMEVLATLPGLRMLMCQDTAAGDDGFVALSRSRTLEYIWGRRCYNLRGRGFAALANLPALRGLSVSCKHVDDAALSRLPQFPALRELMPMDVPDAGFRHVGRCTSLEALWCMYCRDTTDAATEQIAGLSALRTYYAGQTQITDRSLEILGRMSSLERVTIASCGGVTDEGVAALAALPNLRELVLELLPRVTREGAASLPARVRVTCSS